jgi:hypothetical protein
MGSKSRRATLGTMFPILAESIGNYLIRIFSGGLKKEALGDLTDHCLEFLLSGMKWAFFFSRKYRKNIKGFSGAYLFRTGEGLVAASVVFDGRKMTVLKNANDRWDVRVTFKDVQAFWKFIFSRDQDILNLVLANEVEIDGNLNYIYKFGFLARDLAHRLEPR